MKGFDRIFKSLYSLQCYVLLIIPLLLLTTMLYFKVSIGRILYFGFQDFRNIGYQNFFHVLSLLYSISILLVITYPFFAMFMINTKKIAFNTLINKIGILGFISCAVFHVADPFGIWMYYID
jgi:hypothetical protein